MNSGSWRHRFGAVIVEIVIAGLACPWDSGAQHVSMMPQLPRKCSVGHLPGAQLEAVRVAGGAVQKAPFLDCQFGKPDNRDPGDVFRRRAGSQSQSSSHIIGAAAHGCAKSGPETRKRGTMRVTGEWKNSWQGRF